jgi:hypothetical protein
MKGKGKAIPVTGRGGATGCETSRLPQFLDNRLTDGGEVVGLTPPATPLPTVRQNDMKSEFKKVKINGNGLKQVVKSADSLATE